MEETKIEWARATFNPWWGCVKVSPGCTNCYAEAFDRRTHGTSKHVTASGEVREPHWGKDAPRRYFGAAHWMAPVKWDRQAKAAGQRWRVFCASMADVFEDHPDVRDARARLALLIAATPNLDWLLLTKRPENILRLWPWGFPENVWLGTTVEDQQRADERIPHLLAVPARVRFLSVEPMLGPIDLMPYIAGYDSEANGPGEPGEYAALPPSARGIHWVIVGGESGHGARPFDVAWARSVVRQTREAGVACFVKQLGAHPIEGGDFAQKTGLVCGVRLDDPKGGEIAEWPEDLRVREFPGGAS